MNRIQDEAMKMKLWDNGRYIRSIESKYENGKLILFSDVPYAPYLEYGTLDFGAAFSDSQFPEPMLPKKKDIDRDMARQFPRGMQSFAPFRKVMYNPAKVELAIKKALA